MIYTFSIISSTGYPFYYKQLHRTPKSVDIHLRFYNFCNLPQTTNFVEGFELFAGLISALSEFSNLLGQNLELLKFKVRNSNSNEEDGDDFIKKINNPLYPIELQPGSDAIINCQNERFLNPIALEAKINLIFDKNIKKLLPLGPDQAISENDEQFMIQLLDNLDFKQKINANKDELEKVAHEIINEYAQYGIIGMAIMAFDYSPLQLFNFYNENLCLLLRNVGKLPQVKTFNWKHRIGFIDQTPYNLYLVNSGIGVTIEGIFMPFHYLIICKPDSYLAEIPRKIYQKFNEIIDKD